MLSDSNSGLQQIANGGHTIRSKRIAEYVKSLHADMPTGTMTREHVNGDIQLADALTKIKDLEFYNETFYTL